MGGGIDSARETGDDDVAGLAQLARDIFCKPPPVGGYISRTDDPHCRAFEYLHVAAVPKRSISSINICGPTFLVRISRNQSIRSMSLKAFCVRSILQ